MKKLSIVLMALLVFSCAPTKSVKGISIPQYSIGQLVGKTLQLDVQFTPSSASNKQVSWSVADPQIASVSSSGLFTALKAGKTTITATSLDGAKTATAKVTVWVPMLPRKLQKFEPADGRIYSGAGQNSADVALMDQAMHPDRRPLIINMYDRMLFNLHKDGHYEVDTHVAYQSNMFPGSILEVGYALPKSQDAWLERFGNGDFDGEILKAARYYGAMNVKILFRIGWEFEANVYDPAGYVKAYKRVVDIFRSQNVENVAYVWNCSAPAEYDDWYPGDDYVDWFAYDDLNSIGHDKSFQGYTQFFDWAGYAAAHGKPVMIGEQSTWDIPFDKWLPTLQNFWSKLRDSPVKAYQYINTNWPTYWGGHFNSQFTRNADYVKAYNQEMENPVYIHRDPKSFDPNALVIDAARNILKRNTSKPWQVSDDLVAVQAGYSVLPKNLESVTQSTELIGQAFQAYSGWQNLAASSRLDFDLTVAPATSAFLSLEWMLLTGKPDAAVDVWIGDRKALSAYRKQAQSYWQGLPYYDDRKPLSAYQKQGIRIGELVLVYNKIDSASGKMLVSIRTADASAQTIRLGRVRVQTVSEQALQVGKIAVNRNGQKVTLTWDSIKDADRYNIYRDGVIIGFATSGSYSDIYLGKAVYAVSAWHHVYGEGLFQEEEKR